MKTDRIYFEFSKYCDLDFYPLRFKGLINGGRTVNTMDNLGRNKKINLYMCKDSEGKEISCEQVSFDGDYGWSFTKK